MHFTNITLTNVFSYYGSKCFEFGSPSPESNVVLLKGGNGQGKTSFLNALYLLFLSEHDQQLRRRAAGRKIDPVSFCTANGVIIPTGGVSLTTKLGKKRELVILRPSAA